MAKYSPLPTSDFGLELSELNRDQSLSYHQKYRSIFTYNTSTSLLTDGLIAPQDNITEKFCLKCLIFLSYVIITLTAPISLFFAIKSVPKHERLVVFRLGRMRPIIGSGYACVIPFVDSYERIDLRMKAFSIPPQQLITPDNAIVELGAEIRYRIANIPRAVLNVQDIEICLRTTGKNIFVNSISQKYLHQIETEKSLINQELLSHFNELVDKWGLQVVQVEISPVQILQRNQQHPALSSLFGALHKSFTNPPPEQSHTTVNPSQPFSQTNSILDRLSTVLKTSESSGKLIGMNASFEVQITNAETLFVVIQNGKPTVSSQPSLTGPANVVIGISQQDLLDVCNNEVNPLQLYLNGKVKVSGDLALLMSLDSAIQKSTNSTIVNI